MDDDSYADDQYLDDDHDDEFDLIDCPQCGESISELAECCPNCGEFILESPTRRLSPWWTAVAVLLLISMLAAMLGPLFL